MSFSVISKNTSPWVSTVGLVLSAAKVEGGHAQGLERKKRLELLVRPTLSSDRLGVLD